MDKEVLTALSWLQIILLTSNVPSRMLVPFSCVFPFLWFSLVLPLTIPSHHSQGLLSSGNSQGHFLCVMSSQGHLFLHLLNQYLIISGPAGGPRNKTEPYKQLLYLFSIHFPISFKTQLRNQANRTQNLQRPQSLDRHSRTGHVADINSLSKAPVP